MPAPIRRLSVSVVVVLVALTAALAATLGTGLFSAGPSDRPAWVQPERSDPMPSPEPTPTATAAEAAEEIDPAMRRSADVALRILDLALVVCAAMFIVGLVMLLRRDSGSGPPVEDWEDPVGAADPLDLRARLLEGTVVGTGLLGTGHARNAVVSCWVDLEQRGAAAGVPRDPSETAAEYITRLMSLAGAEPEPVHRLAALYREARFSRHELSEETVAAARQALADIAASLRRSPIGPGR